MNWKNRTFFQGRNTRPFAQSADGSRASSGNRGQRRGVGSAIRRFLGWLFLLLIVFGAGLALGLVEDYEAEELISEAKSSFDRPNQRVDHVQWRHVWNNYGHKTTAHFQCRMDCRRVTMDEINVAVRDGYLTDYTEQDCRDDGYLRKYSVEGVSHTSRKLTIVFSANSDSRMLKLITVWERDKDFDCPKDC